MEDKINKQLNNNKKDICKKYIEQLYSLSLSSHPQNVRKGALIGFNSFIKVIKKLNITNEKNLKNQSVSIIHTDIIDEIKDKIYLILTDKDDEIVFCAAQCLYNIIISFSSYVLMNLKFFLEALLIIVPKKEPKIMDISEDMENALKSIINYSFQRLQKGYNLYEFFKLIIECFSLKSSADKRLAISLIIFFNQIPNFQLINILHLFLKDLFELLKDKDVKTIAKKCLDDFYNEISINFDNIPFNIEKKLLDTIITKIISIDEVDDNKKEEAGDIMEIKFNAIKWISLFLKKIKKKYLDTKEKSNNENVKKKEEEIIKNYFYSFMQILDIMLNIIKNKKEDSEYFKKDDKSDKTFYYHFNEITSSLKAFLEIKQFKLENKKQKQLEDIITKYLAINNEDLLKQLVEYIKTLFEITEEDAFSSCKNFMENFSFILTLEDENIFKVGKSILNEIFNNKNTLKVKKDHIKRFIVKFLNNLENKETEFVIKRTGEFIQLLVDKIGMQIVYESFAEVLEKFNNVEFVIKIINIINNQLLDSNNGEVIKFKEGKSNENKKRNEFFKKLFTTWSMNSISCLLLCLISEDFELAYKLLQNFGKISLTQDDLKEYSQIIRIFESKKFTSKFII